MFYSLYAYNVVGIGFLRGNRESGEPGNRGRQTGKATWEPVDRMTSPVARFPAVYILY